jgi:hypothetical protein
MEYVWYVVKVCLGKNLGVLMHLHHSIKTGTYGYVQEACGFWRLLGYDSPGV